MSPENEEHHAPEGTYDSLASLGNERLGNLRTKRFVFVRELTSEPVQLEVVIRVNDTGQRGRYTAYTFRVNPEEQVTGISAERYTIAADSDRETVDNPSVETALHELHIAQKIQPTLKQTQS